MISVTEGVRGTEMDKFSVRDIIVCDFFFQKTFYIVTFSRIPEGAVTNMLIFSLPVFDLRHHYYILSIFISPLIILSINAVLC